MKIADAVMLELEQTELKGQDKKDKAIHLIKVAAKEAGIEIEPFMDRLDVYIEQPIGFVNNMNNKKQSK